MYIYFIFSSMPLVVAYFLMRISLCTAQHKLLSVTLTTLIYHTYFALSHMLMLCITSSDLDRKGGWTVHSDMLFSFVLFLWDWPLTISPYSNYLLEPRNCREKLYMCEQLAGCTCVYVFVCTELDSHIR